MRLALALVALLVQLSLGASVPAQARSALTVLDAQDALCSRAAPRLSTKAHAHQPLTFAHEADLLTAARETPLKPRNLAAANPNPRLLARLIAPPPAHAPSSKPPGSGNPRGPPLPA